MKNEPTIQKIQYTVKLIDIVTMRSHICREYVLFPDGKITCTYHEAGTHRQTIQRGSTAAAEKYKQLCAEIDTCINSADRENLFVDDCCAEVKLFRPFGRVDTMARGYGNAVTCVGEIIEKYVGE